MPGCSYIDGYDDGHAAGMAWTWAHFHETTCAQRVGPGQVLTSRHYYWQEPSQHEQDQERARRLQAAEAYLRQQENKR